MPKALAAAYERWNNAGRPMQVASVWKPTSWIEWFPEYKQFLTGLCTDRLDRRQVVEISPHVETEKQAVQVFLLAMLWGYGLGGLGPFRTRRVLDQPNAKSELFEVAREVHAKGGLSAFKLVADRRSKGSPPFLQWLGPAYGTKFIYFLTAKNDPENPTPVMDSVVSNWFRDNAHDRPLRVGSWHSPSYELFLDSLKEWATDLAHRYGQSIRLDEVEYLIFASQSIFGRQDGPALRDAYVSELSPLLLFERLRVLAHSSQDSQHTLDLIDELESRLVSRDS